MPCLQVHAVLVDWHVVTVRVPCFLPAASSRPSLSTLESAPDTEVFAA